MHVSATSVYGHRPGQIINEDSPVSDTLEIGRIHAATDRAVLALPNSIVFRVPHLYGPDRERSLQRMFNGDFPVIGSGYNVMHHLHVEDFADAVVAAARGTYTVLLNVDDDGPEVYGDYCDFAAQLGGHPPLPRVDADAARLGALEPWLGPHFTQPELATEFVNFMISDTWFDNARAKAELDWTLTFPTFREGLTAIHKDQR